MSVLELEGVSKHFGAIRALDDVSLSLQAGEVLGLMGDNGAGKSTLVKIIAGNFPPSHGEIRVDDTAQTSCPSIFAVGDVTNRVQLTPIAIREGHAFADRVFGGKDTRVAYDCIPSAVFSQPPLASVGLTEAQAREMLGSNVKVFTSDFRPMKNIFAHRHERGLYKLVVDAQTDKVLGVHLIGPEAPEVLQAAAIAVKAGLTKADFDATVALHPSMAEELVLMR